jgi:hypothetical protein
MRQALPRTFTQPLQSTTQFNYADFKLANQARRHCCHLGLSIYCISPILKTDFQGDSLPSNVELPASRKIRLELIKSLDAAKTTISDHWARRDQPAVVEYVVNRFKGYKLVILGHSLGCIHPQVRTKKSTYHSSSTQPSTLQSTPSSLRRWQQSQLAIRSDGSPFENAKHLAAYLRLRSERGISFP